MKVDTTEIARRRRLVAAMCVRGLHRRYTLRELAEKLATDPDPDKRSTNRNGDPWAHETIRSDIAEVEAQWRLEATKDAATWKASFIAQYGELLSIYWSSGDHEGCERVIAAMRKLVGTDSDQVVLFEQLQLQLSIAAQRVRAEFGAEPELAQRVYRAFTGNPRADVFAVPDPPERPKKPEDKN